MATTLVTKTRLAQELGVGKSAVSNWIERGIITGDAIVGEGRRAKIRLDIARAQVGKNRDIGQALGNGIVTKVFASAQAQDDIPVSAEAEPTATQPDVALEQAPSQIRSADAESQEKILAARLEKLERQNRIEAVKEAEQLGELMGVADARRQMAQISGMLLVIFEGALIDFASVISSKFDIPQRDALHLLKNEFRKVRQSASTKQRQLALQTPRGTNLHDGLER